jgi:hypothetical protein
MAYTPGTLPFHKLSTIALGGQSQPKKAAGLFNKVSNYKSVAEVRSLGFYPISGLSPRHKIPKC